MIDERRSRTARVLHTERSRDLGGNEVRIAQRAQPDEEDAVRERPGQLRGRLQSEPRFSGSARPRERDESHAVREQGGDLADLAPAADQGRGGGRHAMLWPGRLRSSRRERGVLSKDRGLELSQLPAGLKAELLHERAARVAVGLERLRLAAER